MGLISEGALVTALEPAIEMQNILIEKARDQIAARLLTVQSESLQSYVPHLRFDVMVLAMVIDHIEDPNEVFSKAQACLAKSGRLVISCVNPYYQLIVRKAMVCQDEQRNGVVFQAGPDGTIRAYCHMFGTLLAIASQHGFALRVLREAVIEKNTIVAFPELADQMGYPYIYSALFQLLPDIEDKAEGVIS
jgi:hypothetical protein